tara:strand:+ start:1438 stop:1587 length:150 start_codon:yes stop_codon:yes gene_type:complete
MKEIQTTLILLQYCPFYPDMWVKMWVKNEIAVSKTPNQTGEYQDGKFFI